MTTLLAACALLTITACGRQQITYPPEFEINFRSACEVDNPPRGYCDCVLARIKTEIPPADMLGLDQVTPDGREHPMQSRIERFGRECLNSPNR